MKIYHLGHSCFKVKLTILNFHFLARIYTKKKGQLSCPKFSDSLKVRIKLIYKMVNFIKIKIKIFVLKIFKARIKIFKITSLKRKKPFYNNIN